MYVFHAGYEIIGKTFLELETFKIYSDRPTRRSC